MRTHCVFPIALLASCGVFLSATEWHQEKDLRWRELPNFRGATAGFKLLSNGETGLYFTNLVSEEAIARNRVVENGAGVALGDFDGDGLPDVFACGIESASRLYRNGGEWKFEDWTSAAELPTNFIGARGAVFADVNGDGRLDLLVSTVMDGVRVFLNGGGKFREVTKDCGLAAPSGATTLTLADIDGNGTLDLYVTNYRTNDIRDVGRLAVKSAGGKTAIPPQLQSRFTIRQGDVVEYGEPDRLFLNDGKGHFTPVSWTEGAFLDAYGKPLTEPPRDWGLSAAFRDVNGDGAPDLYVCNDYWTPDQFWINDGKGRFRAASSDALRKIPFSSMGVDFADVNRDGYIDIFCVEMLASDPRVRKRQMFSEKSPPPAIGMNEDIAQVFQNTLLLNRGDGTFAEAAYFAGLAATDWSWSPLFIDVDLDGYEDLLISAGHFHDVQDLDANREIQRRQHSWSSYTNEAARQKAFTQELIEHYRLYPPLNLPIHAFRNSADLHFKDMTESWGFAQAAVHHGMALADLDGDGDLDLVANCFNSGLKLYRNEAQGSRIAIRLEGAPPNTKGIGAKIVLNSSLGAQRKEITAGGHYLSGSETLVVFGFRSPANLEVTWRNGSKSIFNTVVGNRLYEINQPTEMVLESPAPPQVAYWFEDASERLNHVHLENQFDDFKRQPTLPFKLSQRGPACGWFDLDGDGYEDLIIGSGANSAPAIFRSDGKGSFTAARNFDASGNGDCLGLIGWRGASNNVALFAAWSGYEIPQKAPLTLLGSDPIELPPEYNSSTVLALGSFAPFGNMALFVGGDIQPGRYPLTTRSALLRFENGQWKFDAANSAALASTGIVNSAIWSDLDSDGISELLIACEWGPIRVFQNRAGNLREITTRLGLTEITGLWRGIATADVNGDGRMDIIAANWGLNSPWRASAEQPMQTFFGEWSQPGRADFVETEWDAIAAAPTACRPLVTLTSAMPFLMDQFPSFNQMAEASVVKLLGSRITAASQLSVKTLASTLFLNRNGGFEAVELPLEAQLAPNFSINASDFDGDGNIDIFLTQNFSAMHPDYARQDAGRGLVLKGDGHGGFTAAPGDISGIKMYGEQRAAATCDFDNDGRTDLAVTQNGAQTKLYHNVRGTPGMRVRLIGPAGNPLGIGAQIWAESGATKTPVQEIQAGSGYLAQESAVKIIHAATPGIVHVRWPVGNVSSAPFTDAMNEISIRAPTAGR